MDDALETLKNANKNAYIAFLFGLLAGLRKDEIDKLLWQEINFDHGVLYIRSMTHFDPKTNASSSDVKLAQLIIDELKYYKDQAEGVFVLSSKNNPIHNATWAHYRCQKDFIALNKWLRDRGISEQKPLHTLRKEYGAQICRDHGIYVASRALRHSSTSVTEKHYVDSKAMVVPNFS
jgi:integrase